MIDLAKEKLEIKCNCGKKYLASLKDVVNHKIIKCPCGANIELKDNNGSLKKGINNINEAFKNLDNAFKNF